jgi:hypothetical protein
VYCSSTAKQKAVGICESVQALGGIKGREAKVPKASTVKFVLRACEPGKGSFEGTIRVSPKRLL